MYPYNIRKNNPQNAPQANPNLLQGTMFYMQPNQQIYNYQQMTPANYAMPYNYQAPTPFQAISTQRQVIPTPAVTPASNNAADKQKLYKLEQQRKFKDFGKNYRQTSIDSMLSNIIASPNKPKASQKKPEVVADDFGEFLQAPVLSSKETIIPINDSNVDKAKTSTPVSQVDSSRQDFSVTLQNSNHATMTSNINTVEFPKQDDLQAKMLASLDLSQSKHVYRNFKPLAHHQIPKREKKTYQVSAKAADWSSLNAVEGIFQEPEPVLLPEPVSLPRPDQSPSPSSITPWLLDIERAPLVYKHVYEACVSSDGLMDTSRLSPILLQCNLPNETLGHLWSLANQTVPGRLNQKELFVLLALIAMTQNGCGAVTVEHVIKLPAAPVPFLSAYATPENQSDGLSASTDQSRATTPATAFNQPNISNADDFGDFQEFQSRSDAGGYDVNQKEQLTSLSAATTQEPSTNGHTSTLQNFPDGQPHTFDAFSSAKHGANQTSGPVFEPLSSKQASVFTPEATLNLKAPTVNSPNNSSPTNFFKPIRETIVDTSAASNVIMNNSIGSKVTPTPETNTTAPFDFTASGKKSPLPQFSLNDQSGKSDKYAVFSEISQGVNEFQAFQENTFNSPGPSSFASDFTAFNPPNDSSLFNSSVSTSGGEEKSSGLEPNKKNGFASEWDAFANPENTTENIVVSLASEPQTTDSMSWFPVSNSSRTDVFKSVATNAVSKLDLPPIPSDNNSVQSLELNLSHIISQQSLGTLDNATAAEPKPRKSPVGPEPAPRKYGPSFCDDDYDLDSVQEPPPDLPSGAYDEFDVFQEGTSTLVGFDAFEQPEKPEKRLPGPSFPGKKRESSSETSSASPVPSPQAERKSLDRKSPAFEITKQRLGFSTPPLTPVRIRTDSLNSSARSSRRESINSPVDWHIHLTPTEQANAYVEKWGRCLKACAELVASTNNLFGSIASPEVCKETVYSVKGQRYIADLSEVYGISKRICLSCRTFQIESEELQSLMKQIEMDWHNLLSFCPDVPVMDHSSAAPSSDTNRCGVCLQGLTGDTISYAGSVYHSTCANFWVNRVEPLLPAFKLPDVMSGFG